MSRIPVCLFCGACFVAFVSQVSAYPNIEGGLFDPYARALNCQVREAAGVQQGESYWRVHRVETVPPPDDGFGLHRVVVRAIDEQQNQLYSVPATCFNTYDPGESPVPGGSISVPGECLLYGGTWTDPFYDHLGPYSVKMNDGLPSEALLGFGLPANQHWEFIVTFQRAVKGTTPTWPQPPRRSQPHGQNLLTNPGAERGSLSGWSQTGGFTVNSDIFNNSGRVNGDFAFSIAFNGLGGGTLSQTVPVIAGAEYTFGGWVVKKSADSAASIPVTMSWSDNAGGGGTLYDIPGSTTIYHVYQVFQDATFVPAGDQVTITISASHNGGTLAACHFDQFWLVETACADDSDADNDGVGDLCDNCPDVANGDPYAVIPVQPDSDEDGIGDACDGCDNNAGSDTNLIARYSFETGTDGFVLNTSAYCGSSRPVQRSTTGGSSHGSWHVWAPGEVRGDCGDSSTLVEIAGRSIDTTDQRNLFIEFDLRFDDINAFETSDVFEVRVVTASETAVVAHLNREDIPAGNLSGWNTYTTSLFPASAENASATIQLAGLTSASEESYRIDNIRLYALLPPPDADGDGVRDACDLCPNTISGAAVDGHGCPPAIPGDFDSDGDVDDSDFIHLHACTSGPEVPQNDSSCLDADFDADGDVDQEDFGVFQLCFSGENQPGSPDCE